MTIGGFNTLKYAKSRSLTYIPVKQESNDWAIDLEQINVGTHKVVSNPYNVQIDI